MKKCLSILAVLVVTLVQAQKPDLPSDFLSSDFHKERRELVRGQMPPNSVSVIFF